MESAFLIRSSDPADMTIVCHRIRYVKGVNRGNISTKQGNISTYRGTPARIEQRPKGNRVTPVRDRAGRIGKIEQPEGSTYQDRAARIELLESGTSVCRHPPIPTVPSNGPSNPDHPIPQTSCQVCATLFRAPADQLRAARIGRGVCAGRSRAWVMRVRDRAEGQRGEGIGAKV
jgi:hypothetical protein